MMLAQVIAQSGRRGLAIPLAPFRERVGGDVALRKILRGFTVTEKVTCARGRPKGMARASRHAYVIDRAAGLLLVPRSKGELLRRTRTPAGAPLLDDIQPGANGTPDAPLPAARRIDPASCGADEPLYEYQEAAVAYICEGNITSAQPRDLYLQMDTGLGKTRVGCAVIARRGEPGLIVVPTEAIAFQWLDELAESYPGLRGAIYRNEDERRATAAAAVGRACRAAACAATHDVVVVIVNTFREKTPAFLEGFGVVVLDEAHELQSAHNSRALWLAQTALVVGLSATPLERPDGLDRYTVLHLGTPVRPADIPGGAVTTVNFRGEVRMVEYAGKTGDPCCETVTGPTGTMSAVLTIGRVLSDAARRRMVALEVRRLLNAHEEWPAEEVARCGLGPRPAAAVTDRHPLGELRRHGVFVFAELREALPALRDELEQVLGPGIVVAPELDLPATGALPTGALPTVDPAPAAQAISILRGGVARDAVGNARALRAHVVLTTYGFSRRGISLPDMTALVLASPRRHGSTQTLGRILRRGSDESILRVVVDIVDVCTGLRGQSADRKRAYTLKGYPVTKVVCSFADFVGERLADEMPVDERLVDERLVDENLADERLVGEMPVGENLADERLADGAAATPIADRTTEELLRLV